MDTLWIVLGTVAVSIVTAVRKSRRAAPRNLGYVSRDWVMRHSSLDHAGV